jgi:hypothetical protein
MPSFFSPPRSVASAPWRTREFSPIRSFEELTEIKKTPPLVSMGAVALGAASVPPPGAPDRLQVDKPPEDDDKELHSLRQGSTGTKTGGFRGLAPPPPRLPSPASGGTVEAGQGKQTPAQPSSSKKSPTDNKKSVAGQGKQTPAQPTGSKTSPIDNRKSPTDNKTSPTDNKTPPADNKKSPTENNPRRIEHQALQFPSGLVLPRPDQIALRPAGCPRCRAQPGCAPSCWKEEPSFEDGSGVENPCSLHWQTLRHSLQLW